MTLINLELFSHIVIYLFIGDLKVLHACIYILHVFMLFVFSASLLLIDYGQPALMSKLAIMAARHCV